MTSQEAVIVRLEGELQELEESRSHVTNKHKEELENLKNELTRQHDEKLQHYSELLHAKELEVICYGLVLYFWRYFTMMPLCKLLFALYRRFINGKIKSYR